MVEESKKYTSDEVDNAVKTALAEERIARLEERFIMHMEKEEKTFKEMREFFEEFRDSQLNMHDKLQNDLASCKEKVKQEILNTVAREYTTKLEFTSMEDKIKLFKNRILWTVSGGATAIIILVYIAERLLPIVNMGP